MPIIINYSITECIGEGNFGTVHKGLWKVPEGVLDVAVKTLNLNPKSLDDNEIKFLKEAAIMGQFIHTNVVKLLGVVTVGEPVSCLYNTEVHWGLNSKMGSDAI